MAWFLIAGFCLLGAPGEVRLSDGKTFAGDIDLPAIGLFVPALKKNVRIAAEEVALIRTWIEKEELVQAWVFVEESSRVKIRLPDRYPVRTYATEVFLKSGQVVRGHVTAASFLVAGDDEDTKLILRANHKGETGQTLEDLVYVKEIAFKGALPPEAKLLSLTGSVPGARELFLVRDGAPSAAHCTVGPAGAFTATDLLPGTYFLCFFGSSGRLKGQRTTTGKGADAGGAERPADTIALGTIGAPLKPDLRASLEAAIAANREFFEEKKILAIGAIGDAATASAASAPGDAAPPPARALVGLLRHGKTSYGEQVFVRYELWKLEKATPRWEITERVYLCRNVFPPGTPHAWPRAIELDELSKISIAGTVKELPCTDKVAQAFQAGGTR